MDASLLSRLDAHQLTVEQLKQELRSRNAKVSGTKTELENRLRGLLTGQVVAPSAVSVSIIKRPAAPQPIVTAATDLNSLTVEQLKNELRSRGVKVTGNKPELQARLQAVLLGQPLPVSPRPAQPPVAPPIVTLENICQLTKPQLREALRARNVKMVGNKPELMARLRNVLSGLPPDAPTTIPARPCGLSKDELKTQLRAHGAKVSGSKAELEARLNAVLTGQPFERFHARS